MFKISILFERHFCLKHHVSSIQKNEIFLSNLLDKRSLSNQKTANLFSCVGHHFYLPPCQSMSLIQKITTKTSRGFQDSRQNITNFWTDN